ncbi:hypothetical protein DI392_00700 [Vibrio albus]|uniref:Tip attachment protein J central straight fiber domain-containing protein n=1 Tax=Vibrio albus TaxID=2200953 RepID=A0A2U3BDI8_9VIBR|nr:DUF1983 domain-containing protein [Vibrio albus]PWI34833.1 hypothetical protein DI392_00700 [Vibrio albus]
MAPKRGFRAGRNEQSAQENIELLTGQRGNGLDRAITLRDLASTSLVNVTKNSAGVYTISGSVADNKSSLVSVPTTPTGFDVFGGYSAILLRWDAAKYYGHAHTEVWRGTVESFTDAALIGTTPASVFSDVVSPNSKYYYWVRHVNTNDRAGAYNATLGTLGETSIDVSAFIDDIVAELNDSDLVALLLQKSDNNETAIEEASALIAANKAKADAAIEDAEQDIIDSAQQLNDSLALAKSELEASIAASEEKVSTEVSENKAAIANLASVVVGGDEEVIIAKAISQLSASHKTLNSITNVNLDAQITEVKQIIVDADQALAEMITALETSYQSDDAQIISIIQTLSQSVSSDIESLTQQLIQLSSNYVTADQKISSQLSTLETTVANEDLALSERIDSLEADYRSGDNTLSSSISTLSQTVAGFDQALSQAVTALTSSIADVESSADANIQSLSETMSSADNALSTQLDSLSADLIDSEQQLSSSIDSLSQTVSTNEKTSSQLIASLQSQLTDINSDLSATIKDLSTTTVESDSVIAKAISQLSASAKAVSDAQDTINEAKLTETKETIADIDANGTAAYRAIWAMKAQAGDITAGIGILADSDGTSQVAISASQFFVFDPNTENSLKPLFAITNGVVAIPKAYIEEATIDIIQAQEITADYVRASITIETPTITSAVINGAELNIGSGGAYNGYHTRITPNGVIYTDYIVASGGTMDNITIGENCTVKGTLDGADGTFTGTVYADKILGDIVGMKTFSISESVFSETPIYDSWNYTEHTLYSFTIAGNPEETQYARTVVIPSVKMMVYSFSENGNEVIKTQGMVCAYVGESVLAASGTLSVISGGTSNSLNDFTAPMSFTIPAGTDSTSVIIKLRHYYLNTNSLPLNTQTSKITVYSQTAPVQINKESSQFL